MSVSVSSDELIPIRLNEVDQETSVTWLKLGPKVGSGEGRIVGSKVGCDVGRMVTCDGLEVGLEVGIGTGAAVRRDGVEVGIEVGIEIGAALPGSHAPADPQNCP